MEREKEQEKLTCERRATPSAPAVPCAEAPATAGCSAVAALGAVLMLLVLLLPFPLVLILATERMAASRCATPSIGSPAGRQTGN